MSETALYRHFDKAGTLLYVGISLSPTYRLQQHQERSYWARCIAHVTVAWFSDRESALAAEGDAIKNEAPLYNVVGSPVRQSEAYAIFQLETAKADGWYLDRDVFPVETYLRFWEDEWPEYTHLVVTPDYPKLGEIAKKLLLGGRFLEMRAAPPTAITETVDHTQALWPEPEDVRAYIEEFRPVVSA